METDLLLLILGSIVVALLVTLVSYWLASMAYAERLDHRHSPLERSRRVRLRELSTTWRLFEPMVDSLAEFDAINFPKAGPKLQQSLELLDPSTPWKADEFIAVKQLESVLVFVPSLAIAWLLLDDWVAVFPALLIAALTPFVIVRGVHKRARQYLKRYKSRLPYVVDLMALMLESGDIFRETMLKAAHENRNHPLGVEFSRVSEMIGRGERQADALRTMSRRLEDPDVGELVFTINTAVERGTELREAMRDMAEQMRIRRIQYLERAAEEAKVHITWPALLVMVACLMIVAAPLLLQAVAGQ